jgi:hypothetical protein
MQARECREKPVDSSREENTSSVVAVVFQWCSRGVPIVFQWYYSRVPVVLQWCYSGVAVVL